jgi:hypothetical protein
MPGALALVPLPHQNHSYLLCLGCRYVALVSGVSVGDGEGNPLHLQLLVDYLGGLLGGSQEQDTVSKASWAGRSAYGWAPPGAVQGSVVMYCPCSGCPTRLVAAACELSKDFFMASLTFDLSG